MCINKPQDSQHGGFTEGFAVEYFLIGIIARFLVNEWQQIGLQVARRL